jgi:hypothetical protein
MYIFISTFYTCMCVNVYMFIYREREITGRKPGMSKSGLDETVGSSSDDSDDDSDDEGKQLLPLTPTPNPYP